VIRFRKFDGPTVSTETERREAEDDANAARLVRWVTVSGYRRHLAEIDAAVEASYGPGRPTLLSAYDASRGRL
jgi:hypothetical protein